MRGRTLPGPCLRWNCSFSARICCTLLWITQSFFCLSLRAQHYSFDDPSDGLGNLNVTSMAQDAAGYLWVGTENGLYRFDGLRFTRIGSAHGLRTVAIQALYVEPGGALLVGTQDGVYYRNAAGDFRELAAPPQAPAFALETATRFSPAGPGRVLLTDHQRGYLLQKDGVGDWHAQPLATATGIVHGIAADRAGNLWYGCGNDLCRIDHGRPVHLGTALHLPPIAWPHLLFDRGGHLWLRNGTQIIEIDPFALRSCSHPLPRGYNVTEYDALNLDAGQRIIATEGPSFGIWQRDHWQVMTQHQGLSRYGISAILADHDGILWFGSIGHGLQRWIGQSLWEAYTGTEGLSNETAWSSLRDGTGRLWIATDAGLDWLDPVTHTVHLWHGHGSETQRIGSLVRDNDGALWYGTLDGVLGHIDPHSFTSRQWRLSKIYHLAYGPDRRLWIATINGLYRLDPAQPASGPTIVSAPAILHPRACFRDLKTDSDGTLWAASDDGLYRLDARGWTRMELGAMAPPHLIAPQSSGALWAYSAANGLVHLRIRGSNLIESTPAPANTLLSDQIVALLIDHRGWLWVGQDAGLSLFDGRSWHSFKQEDGLVWNDLNSNGLYEDADHSLWVGTSGGLAHLLDPSRAITPPLQTPAIAEIRFSSIPVAPNQQIRWQKGALDIALAPLNFRYAHKLHLYYRLLGFDSAWTESLSGRPRFTALPPGRYTLEVVVSSANGVLRSAPARISFRITPRWWQSRVARVVIALLLIAATALLWRWRVRHLLRQKRQLEQAVAMHTREIAHERDELLRTREQLRQLAEHDGLTGLLNHRVILERLYQELTRAQREGQPLTVIIVDLDLFKQINDTHGHLCGDQVLKEISATLQCSVRSYDCVGRYGGEEFLLILPHSDIFAARQRAEQIRRAIANTIIHEGARTLQVTASLGLVSGLAPDAQTMIRIADDALYQAKDQGRNCVVAIEADAGMVSIR